MDMEIIKRKHIQFADVANTEPRYWYLVNDFFTNTSEEIASLEQHLCDCNISYITFAGSIFVILDSECGEISKSDC